MKARSNACLFCVCCIAASREALNNRQEARAGDFASLDAYHPEMHPLLPIAEGMQYTLRCYRVDIEAEGENFRLTVAGLLE